MSGNFEAYRKISIHFYTVLISNENYYVKKKLFEVLQFFTEPDISLWAGWSLMRYVGFERRITNILGDRTVRGLVITIQS